MELTLPFVSKEIFIALFLLVTRVYSRQTVVKYVTLNTKFASLIGSLEIVSKWQHGYQVNTSYMAFRGIPYAEPPVGPMRWNDPVVKRPLPKGTILDATVDKSPCPQWILQNGTKTLIGDENCLHLSVFVPVQETTATSTSTPLKILVFFHGGGFIVNSDRDMIPIPLLAHKNCIIIMFNYRISIFGYLSTGTASLPGNYAFLDQIAVLKWVQLYIREFGGDPQDVTIFGSSIGSVSIHFLLLSKLASGLFHKAIMESGSAFCERSLVPNPLDVSTKLANFVGCPAQIQNEHLLISCLRSKSALELMTAAKHLTVEWVLPSVLGPVIDKNSRPANYQFLTDFPENLPVVNKVPVITGITRAEGLTAFVKLSKRFSQEQLNNLNFIESTILPHYLNLIMRSRKQYYDRQQFIENLSKEAMQLYFNDLTKDSISTLVGILGDLWINTCFRKTLEHLCINEVPSVYAYLFTHRDAGASPSEISKDIQAFHRAGINHPILDNGAAHTEEILYILEDSTRNLLPDKPTAFTRNQQMSDILSNIWTNFAAYGLQDGIISSGWPKWGPVCYTVGNYSLYDPNYSLYEISLDSQRAFYNYRLREAEFWWNKHLDTIYATNT